MRKLYTNFKFDRRPGTPTARLGPADDRAGPCRGPGRRAQPELHCGTAAVRVAAGRRRGRDTDIHAAACVRPGLGYHVFKSESVTRLRLGPCLAGDSEAAAAGPPLPGVTVADSALPLAVPR